MDSADHRARLQVLATERGDSLARLSRLLGRNDAYLQQFVTRGSPKRLDEQDRAWLARYFGVAETELGGPEAPAAIDVPRLDIGASAGPGGIVDGEARRRPAILAADLLRHLGVRVEAASMIRVAGDSMAPTLHDGDEILVDRDRREIGRGGIHVVRFDGVLLVKRVRRAIGGIELVSDNPDYLTTLAPAGAVEVIGKVMWVSRIL